MVEAYYRGLGEVAGFNCYTDVFEASVLPAIEEAVKATKGVYDSEYLDQYYEDFYKDYFSKNSIESIFAGYDIADVDLGTILAKWGFSADGSGDVSDDGLWELDRPERFARKFLDEIIGFDPERHTLLIDSVSWDFPGETFSFASAGKRKAVKQWAQSEVDFIYFETKGFLYYNQNGEAKGFGRGGLCAVFADAPLLAEDNFMLI